MSQTIGKTCERTRHFLREHGITPFREVLTPTMFASLAPVPAAKTILIPEVVFWLMATVAVETGGTMCSAVTTFWKSMRATLNFLPAKPVTEEAFCTARKRLSLRFLLGLFLRIADLFDLVYPDRFRWHGLRLLALDGMKTTLGCHAPLRNAFPPPSNAKGPAKAPQALLVALVGPWDGVCRGFRLVPSKTSEQQCARRLSHYLHPKDLLLGDRNFPDYRTMAAVGRRRADFLFRLPKGRYAKLSRTATPSKRPDEWYVTLTPSKKLRRQGLVLPETIKVRIVQYQIKGYRPSLLITSLLDTVAYPYEELVALYHERWRQETMHREWKYTLQMSNLRSKTRTGIYKEVLVQLTLNNVIRWIMAAASADKDLRPVDLSFLEAKRLIMAAADVMAAAKTECLPRLYRQLLADLAKETILVRPGRSYPRRHDVIPRNKGHGEFATPAKLPSDGDNDKEKTKTAI